MNISQLANICLSHSAVSARILLPLYTLWINSACSSTNTRWRRFFPLPSVIYSSLLKNSKWQPSSLAFLDTRTFLLYTWQNYAQPLSPFPPSFAFPEHIPREHVAPHHKEIKQIFHHWRGAVMCISTVWPRSLAEVNKWLKSLEDSATSVRLLSDFGALKICATLQGRVSQLGFIACTGCTISIKFYLSLPLPPSVLCLQSPASPLLLPLLWLLFGCTTGTHFKSGWEEYIHIQNLPSLHFTAWKLIFSEGTSPLCWPLVQLQQLFWPYTFFKALVCFLSESPFPS